MECTKFLLIKIKPKGQQISFKDKTELETL